MRALSFVYLVIAGLLSLTGAVVLFLNFYIALYALDPANTGRFLRAGVILLGGSAAIVLAPTAFFLAARRLRKEAALKWTVLPWLALGVYPLLMSIATAD